MLVGLGWAGFEGGKRQVVRVGGGRLWAGELRGNQEKGKERIHCMTGFEIDSDRELQYVSSYARLV